MDNHIAALLILLISFLSNHREIICDDMTVPKTDNSEPPAAITPDDWTDPDLIYVHSQIKDNARTENPDECGAELVKCPKGSHFSHFLEPDDWIDPDLMETKTGETYSSSGDCHNAEEYLRRFVNILLKTMNFKTNEVKGPNEVAIKLVIRDDHLAMLESFGEGREISLRAVDEALSAVFIENLSYLRDVGSSSTSFMDLLTRLNEGILLFISYHEAVWSFMLSVLVPIVAICYTWLRYRSVSKSFFAAVLYGFVSSFCITSLKMYKEAMLQKQEKMMKFPDMPSECHRSSTGSSWFWSDGECERYLRAHNIPSHFEVTPTAIFMRMFGNLYDDSFKYLGSGIRVFVLQYNELSFISQMILAPFACTFLLGVITIPLMLINGGSFHLPFFGTIMTLNRLGKVGRRNSGISSTNVPPPSLPQTNSYTFNFNGNQPILSVKHILDSVKQVACGETTQGPSKEEPLESDVTVREICTSVFEDLSAGDASRKRLVKLDGPHLAEVPSEDEYSDKELFKFTASRSQFQGMQKNIPTWKKYVSGKPPKKVQICERQRHKSL